MPHLTVSMRSAVPFLSAVVVAQLAGLGETLFTTELVGCWLAMYACTVHGCCFLIRFCVCYPPRGREQAICCRSPAACERKTLSGLKPHCHHKERKTRWHYHVHAMKYKQKITRNVDFLHRNIVSLGSSRCTRASRQAEVRQGEKGGEIIFQFVARKLETKQLTDNLSNHQAINSINSPMVGISSPLRRAEALPARRLPLSVRPSNAPPQKA